MLKKTLLKNTREFLEKNFPENFFPLKNSSKKQKKFLFSKSSLIKNKLFKLKKKFNKLSNTSWSQKKVKIENSLFSMHMIKSEFETKQTRNSDFKNRLKEKKKLSILYGNLSNKQINKALKKAHTLSGNTGTNLLLLLESRLDVILYRALFFSTIKSARQWIHYNKILVNHNCINISSYQVNPGDIISLIPKNKKFVGSNILKFLNKYTIPSEALQVDSKFTLNYNELKSNFINTRKHNLNILKLNSGNEQFKKKSNCLISGLNTSNVFRKKNYFIFPNYYFKKLQNKISCVNLFLLKHSIHELNKIFTVSKTVSRMLKKLEFKTVLKNHSFLHSPIELFGIKQTCACFLGSRLQNIHEQKSNSYFQNYKYKLYHTNSLLLNLFQNKKNLFKSKIFLNNIEFFSLLKPGYNSLHPKERISGAHLYKKNFILNESSFTEFKHNDNSPGLIQSDYTTLQYNKHKLKTLLKKLQSKVIQETKKTINLLLSTNYFFKHEKTILINILQKVNFTNYYDILFFLKLKNFFYKKRAVLSSTSSVKKINFKPLNLEISYKTLTIIYLYPTQKLIFPCTLDMELLII